LLLSITMNTSNILKIAFIGRKQNILKRYTSHFSDSNTIERARLNEEAGFSQSNLHKTNNLEQANIVYVRLNPEQVSQQTLKKVLAAQKKASSNAWIINDSNYFENYADKSQCFTRWKENNLHSPEFKIFPLFQSLKKTALEIQERAIKYNGQYLRTSNEDSGKGLYYIKKEDSLSAIQRKLVKLWIRTLTNRVSNSKIISVSQAAL